jgi:hypothetical protein
MNEPTAIERLIDCALDASRGDITLSIPLGGGVNALIKIDKDKHHAADILKRIGQNESGGITLQTK